MLDTNRSTFTIVSSDGDSFIVQWVFGCALCPHMCDTVITEKTNQNPTEKLLSRKMPRHK